MFSVPLFLLCSHDWAWKGWFKQGYPQMCSEFPIMEVPSVSMVNVESWLASQTIAEPSSTWGRPISRIARFKLSCRSCTKIPWVCGAPGVTSSPAPLPMWIWYGIVCSPPILRAAARLKGPKIQTATAYTCQPRLQKNAAWGQIDSGAMRWEPGSLPRASHLEHQSTYI